MRITLLRHGEPTISTLRKVTSAEFLGWVEEYNNSGLCQSSKPPVQVLDHAQKCTAIVCSDLPRSIESAKALGVENITLSDTIFNEAGMPASNRRILKLSPNAWMIIYRVFWLLGYSNNSESFKEAKMRAISAIEKLTEIANNYENVLFVGHGFYNRILANELRKSGWLGPKNPGSKYWSMSIYEYNIETY